MTRADLVQLAVRLTQGPVPTLQKKVYGYQGPIMSLLEALPSAITMDTRVTEVCNKDSLPTQEERIPAYLIEGSRLKGWTLPPYVHYDLDAPATYLAQALGAQFIRDDQGEAMRP